MTQIQILTAAQEALIPEYQKKWQQIEFSTQPIERIRAAAAIKGAYAVMRKPEPEVHYCTSPRAALDFLQPYIAAVEAPQRDETISPESVQSNPLQYFARAAWESFKIYNKQHHAGLKPLSDLLQELTKESTKALDKHLDRVLPQNLTARDIVEQSFLSATPFFDNLNRQIERQGDIELSKPLSDRSPEDWQESFDATASGVEAQLGWLPGKDFLFRGWFKQMLQSTLSNKIAGIEPARSRDAILVALSPTIAEQRFLLENPYLTPSESIRACTWLDFAFSVLNFAHSPQKWLAFQGLGKYCGWIYAVNHLCIVCDRPTKILRDEENLLHGDGEAAIEFADRFAAYAYHNTPLPAKYGAVPVSQWQSQWVLEERDREVQIALIQGIGAVRLCQELPMQELATHNEYSLLQIETEGMKRLVILKRIATETGETYAVYLPETSLSETRVSIEAAIEYVHQNFSEQDFPR